MLDFNQKVFINSVMTRYSACDSCYISFRVRCTCTGRSYSCALCRGCAGTCLKPVDNASDSNLASLVQCAPRCAVRAVATHTITCSSITDAIVTTVAVLRINRRGDCFAEYCWIHSTNTRFWCKRTPVEDPTAHYTRSVGEGSCPCLQTSPMLLILRPCSRLTYTA